MNSSNDHIDKSVKWGAGNYHPLPIVLERGEGVWVWDDKGKKYMDMLSAYSALNQGHRHPKIVKSLVDQSERIIIYFSFLMKYRQASAEPVKCSPSGMKMQNPTYLQLARLWAEESILFQQCLRIHI